MKSHIYIYICARTHTHRCLMSLNTDLPLYPSPSKSYLGYYNILWQVVWVAKLLSSLSKQWASNEQAAGKQSIPRTKHVRLVYETYETYKTYGCKTSPLLFSFLSSSLAHFAETCLAEAFHSGGESLPEPPQLEVVALVVSRCVKVMFLPSLDESSAWASCFLFSWTYIP